MEKNPSLLTSSEDYVLDRPVTNWLPWPDSPQLYAYHCEADELFYGGMAGGGKTDLLLGLAGTSHYRSIIYRRVFPSMRGIIDRSREIYNYRDEERRLDSFNEGLHIWRLANGSIVEFGAMQYDKDVEDYRGRPHDLYAFDEITEFSRYQYQFVTAWLRSTKPNQRCRIVCTGNPPSNAEGLWVIDYWAPWLDESHPDYPEQPGKLRWYVTLAGGESREVPGPDPLTINNEKLMPRSRTFIPASLDDNPALRDTSYRSVLQGLPEPLRSQLLYGKFAKTFDDDPYQIIPTRWITAAMERWKQSRQPAWPLAYIGVDVARGGADKTVLALLYGSWFAPLLKYPGTATDDGQKVTALVAQQWHEGCTVHVDVIGVGSSAYDHIKELYPATAVNFGATTKMMDKTMKLPMANVRSAAYWRLREALDPSNSPVLALPDDRELLADLSAPRWYLRTGKVYVESKEDIKERIGRSPDCGDAVALAYYLPSFAADEWIDAYEKVAAAQALVATQPIPGAPAVTTRGRRRPAPGNWDNSRQL